MNFPAVVVIDSLPLFMVAIITLILSILVLAGCWLLCRPRFRRRIVVAPRLALPTMNEVYIDDDGFSFLGPRWQWAYDQHAFYCCPHCDQSEEVQIKAYTYLPDGKVYAVLRHECSGQNTEKLEMETEQEDKV